MGYLSIIMTVARRIAIVVLIAALLYPVLLIAVSYAVRGPAAQTLRDRMTQALGGDVTLGNMSLGLLTGSAALSELKVSREDGGHVELDISHASVDFAPLGWMLVDPVPRSAVVQSATLSLSARGALSLRNPEEEHRPLRMGSLRLADVRVRIMPTSLLPEVGAVDLLVREAVTGPIHIQSAVDWFFVLRELDAELDLPMSEGMAVTYRDGILTLRGRDWKSPVTVPFQPPKPPPGATDIDKVRLLATELISAVGHQVAARWIKDQVKAKLKDTLLRSLKNDAGSTDTPAAE